MLEMLDMDTTLHTLWPTYAVIVVVFLRWIYEW